MTCGYGWYDESILASNELSKVPSVTFFIIYGCYSDSETEWSYNVDTRSERKWPSRRSDWTTVLGRPKTV